MSKPHFLSGLIVLLAFQAPLLAQSHDSADDGSLPSKLLFTLLPFLILATLLFWFLRRISSGPRAKQTEQYMLRHQQHMETVEKSLERIATALETDHKNSP